MKSEPAALTNGIIALVTAALALLVAFGVDVTQEQSAAILGFVAAVVAFAGFFIRSKVTPV